MRMNRRELIASVSAAALLPAMAATAGTMAAHRASAINSVLHLGPAQRGAGNHRWAAVTGGAIAGGEFQGQVQSGRLDWHVCPMSGATSVAMTCRILRADGAAIELRNQAVDVHAADFTRGRVGLRI
jgi:hypothetical protein